MKAVYSPLHAGHAGGVELYRGALVPTFETPERAEIIRAAIAAAGHALVAPHEVPESRLLRIHDGHFVEFLRGAHARWVAEESWRALRDGLESIGAGVPDVYLVHGEPDAQDAFAEQLRAAGYPSVEAPDPHRKIAL